MRITTQQWAEALGVSTDPTPPPAPTSRVHYKRTATAIATRALLVQGIVAVASDVPPEPVLEWFTRQRIASHLTERERGFLLAPSRVPQNQRNLMRWQQEAEWTLLWMIGFVEALGLPTTQCDTRRLVDQLIPPLGGSIKAFLKAARLRSQSELLAEDQRTYNLWCAAAAAHRANKPLPIDLQYYVLLQRRYAFEWLAIKGSWDEVFTDA